MIIEVKDIQNTSLKQRLVAEATKIKEKISKIMNKPSKKNTPNARSNGKKSSISRS